MKRNKIPKGLDIEQMIEREERRLAKIEEEERKEQEKLERIKQEKEEQEYEELDPRQKFIERLKAENKQKSTHKREPANKKKLQNYNARRDAQEVEEKRREDLLKAMNKIEEQEEK